MGDRYRTPDGWAVEVVGLSATPDRNDGERLKVTYCGFFGESSGIAVDGRGPMSPLVCCPTEPEAPSVLGQSQRRPGRLRRVTA